MATCLRSGDTIWPGGRGWRNTGPGCTVGPVPARHLKLSDSTISVKEFYLIPGVYYGTLCHPGLEHKLWRAGDLALLALMSPVPNLVSGTWLVHLINICRTTHDMALGATRSLPPGNPG